MTTRTLSAALKARLDELFTRMFISAATYVFEAQPFRVPEDEDLLAQLEAIKERDLDHARLLASLLRAHGAVPEPGVFPYWHRDLNYLSVPFLASFVAESLGTDLEVVAAALEVTPAEDDEARRALEVIRRERAAHLETLAPAAAEARAREARAYADGSRAVRETREARLAAEKAAEAARKEAERRKRAEAKARAEAESAAQATAASDPAAGMPDPDEPGISSKEKAKRTMMIKRARKQAAEAAPAPVGGLEALLAGMPDPNEPGISSKEKAKRTMLRKRAQKQFEAEQAAAPAAPAAAPTKSLEDVLAAMPDPDEPGISGKEKAKRTVMRKRAQKKFEDAQAAAPTAPAAAPGKSLDDVLAAMPDPEEPGISGKEKAKRTVMRKRAQKQFEDAQAAAPAAPAAAPGKSLEDVLAAMPDPDEPGISGKEKARRTVLRSRARKQWESEHGPA